MPRPGSSGKKIKVGVSLHPSLHAWAMARVGPGKEFSTLTHALERGLATLAELEVKRQGVRAQDGGDDEPSDAGSRRRK